MVWKNRQKMLLGPRHDNEVYLLNLRGRTTSYAAYPLHAMMKPSLSRVALRLHVNDADPKLVTASGELQ